MANVLKVQDSQISNGCQVRGNWFLKAQTSVKLLRMAPWLRIYPDKEKAELVFKGFQVGFEIPIF